MPSIDERLDELKTFAVRMCVTITYIEDALNALGKRIDHLEKDHNYVMRAFFQMHPERFGDLDRNTDASDSAFSAFVRTHPNIFTDIDRLDAILGVQPSEKPKQ